MLISTEALFDEIVKLAASQAQFVKQTGVGKTRRSRRPIGVRRILGSYDKDGVEEKTAADPTISGKVLGSLWKGTKWLGVPGLVGVGGTLVATKGAKEIKKEYQGWRLGRQHVRAQ